MQLLYFRGMIIHKKWLVIWLAFGLFFIVVQVLLGGITRLTGSGLSITEWEVVGGILPPLNEAEWGVAFQKYKTIPQFELVNIDMQLSGFKFIYFWEWMHRLWARLLGAIFFVPFLYFLYRGWLTKSWIRLLLSAMLLGAAQGLVGWLMVVSGLKDNIYVRHTNLTQHLLMACVLFGYMVWLYWLAVDEWRGTGETSGLVMLKRPLFVLMCIVVVQLAYGGFMAGQRAAIDYPTYPLMNGKLVPDVLYNSSISWYANFIDNKTMIQFIHRLLPWLIVSFVFYLYFKIEAIQISNRERGIFHVMVGVIIIQILLGVLTITNSDKGHVPLLWGVLHQLMGVVFFIVTVSAYYHSSKKAG